MQAEPRRNIRQHQWLRVVLADVALGFFYDICIVLFLLNFELINILLYRAEKFGNHYGHGGSRYGTVSSHVLLRDFKKAF